MNTILKKIRVRESIIPEISGATLVVSLIGYATIIMQISGRLAAANREIEIPTAFRGRKTRERRNARDERLPVF